MFSNLFTRRAFGSRVAALLPGAGLAAVALPSAADAQATGGVKKLDIDGKPAGPGFITPLIVHNGVIYIAGIGAHSHNKAEFPKDITNHTKSVMEGVKTAVELLDLGADGVADVAKGIADGAAVKLHGVGKVLKMSAIGWASASFKFIGGSPITSSIVRMKSMVLYAVETTAPCFT